MLIGLCGNIGSGKSQVAACLQKLGVPVIDADQVSREVVEPGGPAHAALLAAFGPAYFDEAGRLDRRALGALIFSDAQARQKLNEILHPIIMQTSLERARGYLSAGAPAAAVEAALILEVGLAELFDVVWLVEASPEQSIARIMARDGIDREAATLRLQSQLPNAAQRERADWVIVNNGSRQELERQVKTAFQHLLAGKSKSTGN